MKKKVLKNGVRIVYKKVPSKVVTLQVTILSGANVEGKKQYGVSHFVEHMIFEGTKTKPDARTISNEIERLGGDFNATTTNENISYYITVPSKYFRTALTVLDDIYKNSIFSEEKVEKERKVIIDEVNMINDDPKDYRWILFDKTIFEKHPMRNPVYGDIEVLKKISRDELYAFYKKYHIPNNTLITVVGNVPNPISKIEKNFKDLVKQRIPKQKEYREPSPKRATKKEKRRGTSSYLTMGWKTCSAKHKDVYALEVIYGILSRGQSGRLFDEIRGKRGLCYSIGAYHNYCIDIGYFAIHCITDKKNFKEITKLIVKEMKKLQELTEEDVKDAQTYLEGDLIVGSESTQYVAEKIAYWEQLTKAEDYDNYVHNIKKVTLSDIKRVAKKYFTAKYTITTLEQQDQK